MKRRSLVLLTSSLCLFCWAATAAAQTPADDETTTTAAPADTTVAEDFEPVLKYEDYTVKAYELSFFGGSFSGATYMENQELWDRTVLEEGANNIIGYDGEVLEVSRDVRHYDAAHKKIDPGQAFGARVGLYIADDFHLDLVGMYAQGKAVTTMLYTADPEDEPDDQVRLTVDEDDGFSVYMGGVNLVYNASSAAVFNVVPRLGFGLGGVINTYSTLEDVGALYLRGHFGLQYEVFDNLSLTGQYDVSLFAFDVEELGYSNMVSYNTLTVGLSWFIDVIPPQVRAARYAEEQQP